MRPFLVVLRLYLATYEYRYLAAYKNSCIAGSRACHVFWMRAELQRLKTLEWRRQP
jgi:hypothetical protein